MRWQIIYIVTIANNDLNRGGVKGSEPPQKNLVCATDC